MRRKVSRTWDFTHQLGMEKLRDGAIALMDLRLVSKEDDFY